MLRLVDRADALIEGFRPGVADRLGLGPETCLARNPRLVYGRMTGWGQDGPLAHEPGHDINYIASRARSAPSAPPRRPGRAAQPRRRHGRRRDAARARDLRGRPARPVVGCRAGRRRRDDRRDGGPARWRSRTARPRAVDGPSGVRTCSTARRRSTAPTGAPTAGTSRSPRSSRSSTRRSSEPRPGGRSAVRRPARSVVLARDVRAAGGVSRPGRATSGPRIRRTRRVRHTGAQARRGGRTRTTSRGAPIRRRDGGDPAGRGAAVPRHAVAGSPTARRSATIRSRCCASRDRRRRTGGASRAKASSVERSSGGRSPQWPPHQDEPGPDADQEPGEEVVEHDAEPDPDEDPARKRTARRTRSLAPIWIRRTSPDTSAFGRACDGRRSIARPRTAEGRSRGPQSL